ncbi:hypothetical protein [Natrinema amylolyticum]|nr:hypothetical protein [Natrinema amylolyticum]
MTEIKSPGNLLEDGLVTVGVGIVSAIAVYELGMIALLLATGGL